MVSSVTVLVQKPPAKDFLHLNDTWVLVFHESNLQKKIRSFMHAWTIYSQPIDRIGPLQPQVKTSKGQSGVL